MARSLARDRSHAQAQPSMARTHPLRRFPVRFRPQQTREDVPAQGAPTHPSPLFHFFLSCVSAWALFTAPSGFAESPFQVWTESFGRSRSSVSVRTGRVAPHPRCHRRDA